MRSGLEDLPEPAELHARLSARRPLDWGDPIPSKAEIAAQYGADAARKSLTLLAQVAVVEQSITDEFLAAAGSEVVAHQVESRVKSPQSLARKLKNLSRSAFDETPLDDALRYTLVTRSPDELVPAAEHACDELTRRGWKLGGAIQSYADGSRYKGLHLLLQRQGQRIEVQIHSRESIDVKHRTTPLYAVERDRGQPQDKRSAARQAAIALSAQMSHPAGIDELRTLGGVQVEVRVYGKQNARPIQRGEPSSAPQAEGAAPKLSTESQRKDGLSR
ncbi:hypothetical protein GCM10009745_33970 [Kribbella yunnanensis]|uniref:DUF222 domain-containing protein n=1 Tax=Kribbella yunnanensis TaxID=190194 RepID=A0ABP4TFP5_9ACTN